MKINHDIKDQYQYYTTLVKDSKKCPHASIILEPKKNNVRWLFNQSNLEHEISEDKICLIIEKSRVETKYGIKLKCDDLSKTPYFRFDSDGPSHRNDSDEIPLEDQSISTPHFNGFNENGKSIAYKTDTLKDVGNAEAIANDINLGIAHFFDETTITSISATGYPEITEKEPELDLSNEDHLFKGIKFE